MKFTRLKEITIKTRLLPILGSALLASACQASQLSESPNAKADQTEITQTANCPIIRSQNWSAKIKVNDAGKSMISIKGDIELPSPGYSIVFDEGVANFSLPPIQHFNLKAERLDGFYIQAVTPMTLEHSSPANADSYRSIIIHCGEQVIATIENVTQSN